MLNQSIEAYIYAILGSQSKTRQSIVGNRGSALETQVVFRQIVEDSIINYDTSTWIQNMNLAISDTNVVLDIAISPSLWLLPSKIIIPGYNMLCVASKNMKFGLNKNINYYGTLRVQKKIHQDSAITSHLDNLDDGELLRDSCHVLRTFWNIQTSLSFFLIVLLTRADVETF